LIETPVVPPHAAPEAVAWRLPELFPHFAVSAGWWESVALAAFGKLPVMLPFALATVVGGIDCTESAAAVGDEYDTRAILMTEGLASIAAGLAGGVIQTTPYIGQPAYKTMGGRAAYTLATALFIGAAGFFGWFPYLFNWLPAAAFFAILVFVGLEITAQSYHATPTGHYPAVALAALPALAYLTLIPINMAFENKAPAEHTEAVIQALRCLGNGFIITSLLWASALAAILDGKLARAALFLAIAGVCSLFGIIHSPLRYEEIAWPHEIWEQMSNAAAIRSQSPFHWAAGYALSAGLLLVLALFPQTKKNDTGVSESSQTRCD
jgi:AGZA family xanthine/uracil permease-like MFS transporter